MGLTYYVEFRIIDDGKTLALASGVYGAKLKRWKVGCASKTVAKQHEAVIKTKLLTGTMVSERVKQLTITFKEWAGQYKDIEEVMKLRTYKERCQRIDGVLIPFFGGKLLPDITVKDVESFVKTLRDMDSVTRIYGLVFSNSGRKISHTYRLVGRLCQEQKIPNFVFHDLRHCAVTNLADGGVDTETIMKIVGHSSVEMFLRYRTVKAERLDAAMVKLEAVINTPITPPSVASL